MLNIVIPMAGLGSRFSKAGYALPKPLIPVHGMPMIRLVLENLRPKGVEHRFIIIVQSAHASDHALRKSLLDWGGPATAVVEIDGVTEGAACTVLKARSLIDSDDPLMIANCDQFVDIDLSRYLKEMDLRHLDGLIMTMTASDPKWSFVGLDSNGLVTRVVEKEVISNEATVGIYNFRRGVDFLNAADSMINNKLTVNSEYYVAPAYNHMIARGLSIGCYNIGSEGHGMHGLGIPTDLELFLSHEASRRAAGFVK